MRPREWYLGGDTMERESKNADLHHDVRAWVEKLGLRTRAHEHQHVGVFGYMAIGTLGKDHELALWTKVVCMPAVSAGPRTFDATQEVATLVARPSLQHEAAKTTY